MTREPSLPNYSLCKPTLPYAMRRGEEPVRRDLTSEPRLSLTVTTR